VRSDSKSPLSARTDSTPIEARGEHPAAMRRRRAGVRRREVIPPP